jgi:hypothetical protein
MDLPPTYDVNKLTVKKLIEETDVCFMWPRGLYIKLYEGIKDASKYDKELVGSPLHPCLYSTTASCPLHPCLYSTTASYPLHHHSISLSITLYQVAKAKAKAKAMEEQVICLYCLRDACTAVHSH